MIVTLACGCHIGLWLSQTRGHVVVTNGTYNCDRDKLVNTEMSDMSYKQDIGVCLSQRVIWGFLLSFLFISGCTFNDAV